ncbi:MAG: DUF5329 domain-containing protein [Planctomycetota bacterium]
MRHTPCLILALAGIGLTGCSDQAIRPTTPTPHALSGLPLELTIRQRSTHPVPEDDHKLLITLDDITRGQVMVSVATPDGQPLLAPRSMTPNTAATFNLHGQPLVLSLTQLENALLGDDSANFTLTEDTRQLTETQKIERLIQGIADMPDAVFIRNGSEHSAKKAASHLRRKWNAAGDRITTALDFVEHLASRSSMTGKPYHIRTPDGQVTPSRDYLIQQLERMTAEG